MVDTMLLPQFINREILKALSRSIEWNEIMESKERNIPLVDENIIQNFEAIRSREGFLRYHKNSFRDTKTTEFNDDDDDVGRFLRRVTGRVVREFHRDPYSHGVPHEEISGLRSVLLIETYMARKRMAYSALRKYVSLERSVLMGASRLVRLPRLPAFPRFPFLSRIARTGRPPPETGGRTPLDLMAT